MTQNISRPSLSPSSGGISSETDNLFKKWLKLQIAQMYVGMLFKLLVVILIISSIFFSVSFLGPVVQSQLSVLQGMMNTLQGASQLTGPKPGEQGGSDEGDMRNLPAIIQELSPEERAQIQEIIENHSEGQE
jgi:hypothetical protein